MYCVAQARNAARGRGTPLPFEATDDWGNAEDAAEGRPGLAVRHGEGPPTCPSCIPHGEARRCSRPRPSSRVRSSSSSPPSSGSAAVGDPLGADHYLVSRADAGTSDQSELSDDGQHVVFRSTEALVPEDDNGVADVYLATAEQGSADPFSGTPILVSRADATGGIANGPSSEPALSADGRYIVFTSTATNLVVGGSAPGVASCTSATRCWEPQSASRHPPSRMVTRGMPTSARTEAGWSSCRRPPTWPRADADHVADVFVADRDDGTGGISPTAFAIRDPDRRPVRRRAVHGGRSSAATAPTSSTAHGALWPAAPGRCALPGIIRHPQARVPAEQPGRWPPSATPPSTRPAASSPRSPDLLRRSSHSVAINWAVGGVASVVAVGSGHDPVVYRGAGDITDVAMSSDGSRVTWASTQPVSPTGAPHLLSRSPRSGRSCRPGRRATAASTATPSSPPPCCSWAWAHLLRCRHPAARSRSRGRPTRHLGPRHPSSTSTPATTRAGCLSPLSHRRSGAVIPDGDQHRQHLGGRHPRLQRGVRERADPQPPDPQPPDPQPPIHNLPIHNLPIHNLPIHNLPIHNLDLPGGWGDVLAGTPFAGRSELEVTLADVLTWADAHRVQPAPPPRRNSPPSLASTRSRSTASTSTGPASTH